MPVALKVTVPLAAGPTPLTVQPDDADKSGIVTAPPKGAKIERLRVRLTGKTSAMLRLPSVTLTVTLSCPDTPKRGVSERERMVALPLSAKFALGISAGLDEVAETTKGDETGVLTAKSIKREPRVV